MVAYGFQNYVKQNTIKELGYFLQEENIKGKHDSCFQTFESYYVAKVIC